MKDIKGKWYPDTKNFNKSVKKTDGEKAILEKKKTGKDVLQKRLDMDLFK